MSWTISWIGKKGKVVAQKMQLQFTLTILSLQWVLYTSQKYIATPFPPQMVCTNIRIEWKTLGCTHFPEICFHLPSIWHEYQDKKKIPEIWFHPPNVWHKYQDRIENYAFYAHHRNMFTPPRMFCTNIRIEWIFGFSCVFVSPPSPTTHTNKFWQKYRDKMKNLGL